MTFNVAVFKYKSNLAYAKKSNQKVTNPTKANTAYAKKKENTSHSRSGKQKPGQNHTLLEPNPLYPSLQQTVPKSLIPQVYNNRSQHESLKEAVK